MRSLADLQVSAEMAWSEYEHCIALYRDLGAWPFAALPRFGMASRKRALNSAQVAELQRRMAAGESKAAIARALGTRRETVCQDVKRVG
jgi:hypothetical protein